jgi:phenylpyruvate tautomerase PptA (4-oxalocrotonate tautomerase family)
MPFLEVTIPRIDEVTRRQLAEKMNVEFIEATGFEDEVLHICFKEYDPAEFAVGGKLWDGNEGRPYTQFLLHCPRLRHDMKRAIVTGLTGAFTQCVNDPDWVPTIYILEFPYDNIGVNGQLLTDADEELADRPFYYILPR